MNGHISLVLVLPVLGLCVCYPNGPPVNIGHNRKAVCVDMYPSGRFQYLFLQHYNLLFFGERERGGWGCGCVSAVVVFRWFWTVPRIMNPPCHKDLS